MSYGHLYSTLRLKAVLSKLRLGNGLGINHNHLKILYHLQGSPVPVGLRGLYILQINSYQTWKAVRYLYELGLIDKDEKIRRYTISIQGRAVLRRVNDALAKLAANPGSLAA